MYINIIGRRIKQKVIVFVRGLVGAEDEQKTTTHFNHTDSVTLRERKRACSYIYIKCQ